MHPSQSMENSIPGPGAALGTVSPTARFSLYLQNGQHFPLRRPGGTHTFAHRSRKQCCGEFHSRTTLSSSRFQGRTPPNAVPRTPCPKAKARTGRSARHGLPHSTVFAVFEKRAAFRPFGHPEKGHPSMTLHGTPALPRALSDIVTMLPREQEMICVAKIVHMVTPCTDMQGEP